MNYIKKVLIIPNKKTTHSFDGDNTIRILCTLGEILLANKYL